MIGRLLLALVLFTGLFAARPFYGWTRYYSAKQKFAVFYPPGWYLIDPQVLGMDAVNVPRSQLVSGGSVIPENGAELAVWPSATPGATISDLVAQSLRFIHDGATVDQTLLTGLGDPGACKTLRQVEFYENSGSEEHPILQHVTRYYCKVYGRIFIVQMSYWKGNKDTAMLEGLARDAARTLTVFK